MNTNNVDVASMTNEQKDAMIASLLEQAKALKATKERAITFKVSEKGAVSVYGLGRFPVTLYKSQWDKLMGNSEKLSQFIAANSDKLAAKI